MARPLRCHRRVRYPAVPPAMASRCRRRRWASRSDPEPGRRCRGAGARRRPERCWRGANASRPPSRPPRSSRSPCAATRWPPPRRTAPLHSRIEGDALGRPAGPRAISDAPARSRHPHRDDSTADASPSESGVRLSLDVVSGGDRRPGAPRQGRRAADRGRRRAARQSWRNGGGGGPSGCLRNSGVRRGISIPGAGDEEVALARRGTTLVGSVKSAMLVQVVGRAGLDEEAAAELRCASGGSSSGRWARTAPGPRPIVRAILLGDRAGLDEETEERLQEAGTYHVIAISGGNIALLAAALMAAARLAGVRGGVAHVGRGGRPCGLCVPRRRRRVGGARHADGRAVPGGPRGRSPGAAVQLASARPAGATCALDPLAVCDAGAWLTYGATVAILAGTPLLLARVRAKSLAVRAPAGLLAASVSAEAGAVPGERAGVLPRDGGRAVAELRGHPADVGGPGRRHGAGGGSTSLAPAPFPAVSLGDAPGGVGPR